MISPRRPFRWPARAKLGVVIDQTGDLRLATQPGGVDQNRPAAVSLDLGVDRVPGGAGNKETSGRRRRIRLTSEDLPTLGRPITATLTASISSARADGLRASVIGRADHRFDPWVAETAVRILKSRAREIPPRQIRQPIRLLTATITGTGGCVALPGKVRVTGAQTGLAIDGQHDDIGLSHAKAGPGAECPPPSPTRHRGQCHRIEQVGIRGRSTRSDPLASQVTPASRSERPPRGRQPTGLRVDLPTLGKPTMATVGTVPDGAEELLSASIRPGPGRGQSGDLGDHLVGGHAAAVDRHRVFGGIEAPCSRSSPGRVDSWAAGTSATRLAGLDARRSALASREGGEDLQRGDRDEATTVPMSRPSVTYGPVAISRCCSAPSPHTGMDPKTWRPPRPPEFGSPRSPARRRSNVAPSSKPISIDSAVGVASPGGRVGTRSRQVRATQRYIARRSGR